MTLKTYIITRLTLTPIMVIILLTIVFIILRVLPGDPVLVILGPKASPEAIEKLREALGLNKPLYIQYFEYLNNIIHGNFGTSYYWKIPVKELLWPRFLATVELTFIAIIIAIILGFIFGIGGAISKRFDVIAKVHTVTAYAVPVFWLGMILQLVFGIYLKWLPITGRVDEYLIVTYNVKTITGLLLIDSLIQGNFEVFINTLQHLALPSLALGFIISGIIARTTRQALSETLSMDFITAAKARGLPESKVLFRYGLRNALIPIITVTGLQFALLLAGAVLTETTFSYPGLGTFLVESIQYRDYNAVQAAIVMYAIIVAIVNTIIDVLYAFIDPRIRY